ncbi:YcnI family protein [Nocardioides sp. zg-1228]|uniref:YcnI family copper-binding membrane protein n=1 Tax=Nocardioides sp. zg-1228 TaxID=2763008 RepID=UPI001642DCF3|nr:YcnI family protein [Nocardioides sp. zg-1228]MBC2933829.1 YcnI family protein [Nocardioides sp. zg-1228]QSF58601.1 YcnI family protein [Nocardioides sp. zg-1228]
MSIRTLARLGVLPAATAAVALSLVQPAGAHVTATPSTAAAGSYSIVTFSVGHGCEGSPTRRLEIQLPESVLSATPTRHPLYDVEVVRDELDEPLTDSHGNEVTERVGSIVYTARTPLPEGQRDAFELSFQVPDTEGEVLAFPTVQTCQKGETGWTQVPADGQDPDELESPAPSFEVLPAEGGGHGAAAEPAADADDTDSDDDPVADDADDDGSSALGWAGLVAGLLGLAAGGLALARTRTTT